MITTHCTYYFLILGVKANERSKLTLSVRSPYVAMLRRASARRGKSITELVEELAEVLEKDAKEESDYVKRNRGVLAGKVDPKDWDRDDRLGDILRKHAAR